MFDPNSTSVIISGIVSFALGGGMVAYLKFFQEKKTSDMSFIEKDREEMRIEIEVLKTQVQTLTAQLIPISFPVWMKNQAGAYLFVNRAWEIQIGAHIQKYHSEVVGKTDAQLFSNFPEFAKTLSDIDREAEKSGGLCIRENVKFPNGIGFKSVIEEIAMKDSDNVVFFRGYAIPVASKGKQG